MSVLVTWGQSLAPADDQPLLTPQCIDLFSGRDVVQVACGSRHNLFVMRDGTVYAQGNNSHGQLGVKSQDESLMTKPTLVTALDAQKIRMVACGEDFSIAVNDVGQTFSWGKNSHGQTAQECPEGASFTSIKRIRTLSSHRLEGVACGLRHVLAFSEASCVFSWGCNRFGQLGLGRRDVSFTNTPQEVAPLRLLPVRHVSAGGSHSFCLSVSGVLFGWGRNSEGQLGLSDAQHQFAPVQLERLRNRHVVHVACGDRHSVVRTVDGAVFSFGSSECGQLGHGDRRRLVQPQQIQELMGSRVTQVACGRSHTLAVVPSKDAVYVFGSGAHGQLGLGHLDDKPYPTHVRTLWAAAGCSPQLHWTAAGGNASFALGRPCNKLYAPPGQPELEARDLPLAVIDFDLVERLRNRVGRCAALRRLQTVLSSPACLVVSCLDEPHFDPRPAAAGLNLPLASKLTADIVAELTDAEVDAMVVPSLEHLLGSCEACEPSLCDVECLRVALLLPVTVFMRQPRFSNFQTRFARYFLQLMGANDKARQVLSTWLAACPRTVFEHMVKAVKEAAAFVFALPSSDICKESGIEPDDRKASMEVLFKLLEIFNTINTRHGRATLVPAETFYLPEVIDHIDIKDDLFAWRQALKEPSAVQFQFCNFLFLFDGNAKAKLLTEFAQFEMQYHVWLARRAAPPSADPLPFTLLRVHRNRLIEDTLDELERMNPPDFKKQLNVVFIGEEGVDEGGLKKEFFLILFRDIFDPKYGMFHPYEQSRMLWFHPNSYESDDIYLMIGRLLGLAIYNSILVPLNFPLALFKKLLGNEVDLDDLKELDPSVGKSLQDVIDFDGDPNENIFYLNFEINEKLLGGGHRTVELVKNGSNVAVIKANREDYVRRYVDYTFHKSCARQFEALKRGFYQVCGEYLGRLFRPTELQNVVQGSEEYDWESLKVNTTYSGALSQHHELIKWFWEVFLEDMTDQQKKKLLLFVTGSDRVPVVGMSGIRLEISNSIRTTDLHFPIAHTCSSFLELPLYSSKPVLKRQILTAIEHSEGFGME